ncbi:TonB-dependent receptor [bacterium]|nr:TonB-dependent receptor [bacterium]
MVSKGILFQIVVCCMCVGMLILLPVNSLFADDEQDLNTQQKEQKEENLIVFDLGRIEVVGQAEKIEPAARTIVPAEYFDEKLKEDILEAVEQVPGIFNSVGQKNEPEIFLRGFRQGRILMLYDGVPLTTPYYGDLDSSELSLENLAEIKLVRGNASVLYGPNAIAGLVSLVSAKPTDQPNFRFVGSIDQESNYSARLSHGQKMGIFYYQLSAGLRESEGWPMSDDFKTTYDEDGYLLEDGDIREHSAFNQWSAGLKLGLDWGKHELSLSSTYTDAEKEIPPATTDEVSVRYWDFPEWKKTTNVLAGRSQLTETVDFRANFFYHTYDNVLRNYKDDTYDELRWESTYDDYSAGLISRLSWQLSEQGAIRASVQGIQDNHRSQSDLGEPWEEYQAHTYSFLSEGEWHPTQPWSIQLGAGLEMYDFDTVENFPADDEVIKDRTEDINALTWSLGAIYLYQEQHSFSGAISKKNRFPTMNQLFANIDEVDPSEVEISTLDTEQALEYQLSYQYQPDLSFSLGSAAFYYDLNDMIDRPNGDAIYDNISKASFKGLELWGDYQHGSGFQGRMAYTFLQARNESTDAEFDELPYTPENVLHLELGYAFAFGTRCTLGYSYKDSVIQYDNDYNELEIPSYSLWDLTIRHDFDFGLSLTLQGLNLLDEDYYQEIGYERPGRVLKLGLQYMI